MTTSVASTGCSMRDALKAFWPLFPVEDRSKFLNAGSSAAQEEPPNFNPWEFWEGVLRVKETQIPGQEREVARLRNLLWAEVQKLVLSGDLVAHGFKPGASQATMIDPMFASAAEPDYEAGSLASHGLIYSIVRISHMAEPTQAKSAIVTPGAWMLAETANGPIKLDYALRTCVSETFCTWRDAQAAWAALPADRKRTRGKRGKSSK